MFSRLIRPRILLFVGLLACILGANPVRSFQEETSPLRSEFEARLSALAIDDDQGRFNLGLEIYEAKERTVERLDLAELAFSEALELNPQLVRARALIAEAKIIRKHLKSLGEPDYMKMLFSVIGGLGLFLLGMKNMSEGIQAIAGDRMRKMINAVTDNRLLAVGVGLGVTTLVQSSSITTVIVVGLVNSALMQLHQAIGVIMGANIGTTITGWILVLKIGKYGLPLLGISVFVYLFSKKDRWRYLAMGAMGLGLVFFGLELMKNGFKPMQYMPEFKEAFAWFRADDYFGVLKCAAVGCILTFLVQSSSATLGITISLASTGVIPFETAAALVLGENIGTTITAWLASFGTTTVAKRAAYAHVAFNLIGVLWITALFSVYIPIVGGLIESTQGHNPIGLSADTANYEVIITAAIAMVHTGFNVANVLMFLPFIKPFARLLERAIPDKKQGETPHLSSLDFRMVDSPTLAVVNSRGEILKMAGGISKMLNWHRELMVADEPNKDLVAKVFRREEVMDKVQEEVINFLTGVLTSETPLSVANEARQQLRVADEYESISDYISGVLKARLRLDQEDMKLSQEERQGLLVLHDRVAKYVAMISAGFAGEGADAFSGADVESNAITQLVKEMRDAHLQSLSERKVDPIKSMAYSTMLNGYRKVKDHALNIAEALES
ncbi:MAG: phosphate:Na+ symporter [Planctomycetota bacterium]|jgi:phosphate:Na+ symporter